MASRPRILPELPLETWTEILCAETDDSSRILNYYDLKRVAGVSNKFKALLQSRIFDASLFRGIPRSTVPVRTCVTLHPLLHAIDSGISEVVLHCRICYYDDRTGEPTKEAAEICTLANASEFATSPPLKQLSFPEQEFGCFIGGGVGCGGKLKVGTGITVLDVLNKVAELWSAPCPHFDSAEYDSDYDSEDDEDSEYNSISYLEAMFEFTDHNGWTGWMEPEVSSNGRVTLRPRHFDS